MGTAGFYKLERQTLEALESGEISLLDFAVYTFLCLKVNPIVGGKSTLPPGVCFASAKMIAALCPRGISERAVQRSLEHLERLGWIKRWLERGKKGNYPLMCCRRIVADLSGNEYAIDSANTTDWRNPRLMPVASSSALARGAGTEASVTRRGADAEPSPLGETTSDIREPETGTSKRESASDANIASDACVSKDADGQASAREPSADAVDLAGYLRDGIGANDSRRTISESELADWTRIIQGLLDSRYKTCEILSAIEFSQRDAFWKPVIISAIKLKQHMAQLVVRAYSQD